MATSNDQVKHLFAHHRPGGSANLISDGTVLRSYGTAIAVWHEGVVFISADGMTPTTASKHLSGLAYACRPSEYLYTPAFAYGRAQAPTAAECILEAAHAMQDEFKTLCRSRSNMERRIEMYTKKREKILELAARFHVELETIPEATGDLKEKAKEFAAKDKEKRAESARRKEEEQRAQRIIDAGARDLWLQQGKGHLPQSFKVYGADQLTIKPAPREEHDGKLVAGIVVTSQGAEAPLDHVIKALRFYDSRKYTSVKIDGSEPETAFNEYHTNGHKVPLGNFTLDSIDEQGNVRAGCHTFSAAEIARFRRQWKL